MKILEYTGLDTSRVKAAYRKVTGQYADVWTALRAGFGDPALDTATFD